MSAPSLKHPVSMDEVKRYQGRGDWTTLPTRFAKRLVASYLVINQELEQLRGQMDRESVTRLSEQRDDLYAQADSAQFEVQAWKDRCADLARQLAEANKEIERLQKFLLRPVF